MSNEIPPRPTRGGWLRFSLRTLLVLVTLLATGLAYSVSRTANERAAVERLLARRATVTYHDKAYGRVHPGRTIGAWMRELIGWRWPAEVALKGKDVTDQAIREDILPLRSLAAVGLSETSVTCDGLSQLAPLLELRLLALRSDEQNYAVANELSQPTMIDFQDVPLVDAAAYLADFHGMPILLDADVKGDKPLSGQIRNKPLSDALDELFAPHEIGWIIKDAKLLVVPRDAQDEHRAVVERVKAMLPQVKVLVID